MNRKGENGLPWHLARLILRLQVDHYDTTIASIRTKNAMAVQSLGAKIGIVATTVNVLKIIVFVLNYLTVLLYTKAIIHLSVDSRPEQRIQEQGVQEICITENAPRFDEPIIL